MIYKHTQIGHLIIFTMFAMAALYGYIWYKAEFDTTLLIFISLIMLLLMSFSWLTVTIDQNYLRIKFGYGIFSKKFRINEMKSAKSARHHWYHGWGIKYWFKPPTWIFNISGFELVEIEMRNGKRYRIGTDESDKLEFELNQLINN